MYSSQPHPMKFRENLSWGFEVRYGPDKLEALISRKSYSKPFACVAPIGQIGNIFIPCEFRLKAGQSRRVIVSVWISSPVSSELSSGLRGRLIHLHKVARRIARLKAYNFFKERLHGQTRKKDEVLPVSRGNSPETGERTTEVIDW
jgi:hypothetical protein